MILTQDVIKRGRSVFSRKDLVAHKAQCNATAANDNLILSRNSDFPLRGIVSNDLRKKFFNDG